MCFLGAMPLFGASKEVQMTFHDSGIVKESYEATVGQDGKSAGIIRKFNPDGTLKLEMPIVEAGGELDTLPRA